MFIVILVCLVVLTISASYSLTEPSLVVIKPAGGNLLKDDAWISFGAVSTKDGMFICDNGDDEKNRSGIRQVLRLGQTTPMPVVAAVYSKSELAGGMADAGYSLNLEVVYCDGERLEGKSAIFPVDRPEWIRRRVLVLPTKPIKEVTFCLNFCGHAGKAIFRRPALGQFPLGEGEAMLDDLFVRIAPDWRGGFAIRDVAGGSDFMNFAGDEALGVKLSSSTHREGDVTKISASIRCEQNKDRAMTLIYAVPVNGEGLRWFEDPRREMPVVKPRCYLNNTRTHTGRDPGIGSGAGLGRYPLAAVAAGSSGQAIAMDMSKPAVFRVGYSSAGFLYIAYDIALTAEKSSAEISFCLYPFDAEWGFRSALAKFYSIFSRQFCRTIPKMGIWMPFYKISQVKGWEDFGFAFKEHINETVWDDQHGILTFHYTEPMTWWMQMPPDSPKNIEFAAAHARTLAKEQDPRAVGLFTSGYQDESGRFIGVFPPRSKKMVFSMNSAPGIAGNVTDFSNKWNPDIRNKLYGPGSEGDLDGEYIDSAEGYITADLDFERSHFPAMQTPLTFSAETFKPAVFRWLIAFEYIRPIAEDVHAMGKHMMANSTPTKVCWLAPMLDVCGTEINWFRYGYWKPSVDEDLLFSRSMCGPKPFCLLMNTDFDKFDCDLPERFMKRCCAYGMFPGFFSPNAASGHYFSRPELYERDRELFLKYIPLCRMLAEAGWQPITNARSDNPSVYLERFGNGYLSVYNDSDQPQEAIISMLEPSWSTCRELLADREINLSEGQIKISLPAWDLAVWKLV